MMMTVRQRNEVLDQLKRQMPVAFITLSKQQLFFATSYATMISDMHHDDGMCENIVIHIAGSEKESTVLIMDDDNQLFYSITAESNEFAEAIVFALKSLRVPARLKSTKLAGCPVCEHYHPTDFNGDCREDGNRFQTPNEGDDIATHFDNGDPGTDYLEWESNHEK